MCQPQREQTHCGQIRARLIHWFVNIMTLAGNNILSILAGIKRKNRVFEKRNAEKDAWGDL